MKTLVIPVLIAGLLSAAPVAAQDPMVARMSDANLTCQQIFDEATQLEARIAEAPPESAQNNAGSGASDLATMAQREAYSAGVDSRISSGIRMLGGMFARNAQANAGQQAEQARTARARWTHLNGLYERRRCGEAR